MSGGISVISSSKFIQSGAVAQFKSGITSSFLECKNSIFAEGFEGIAIGNSDTSELLKSFTEKVLTYLDWEDESIETCLNDFSEKKCVSKGKLIQPLRVSLCGSLTGPSMANLMSLLGKETCIRRINNAQKILSK